MDIQNPEQIPAVPPIQPVPVAPKRKWWKIILIVVGSIVVLIAAFVGIVFWATAAPVNLTREFMNAMSSRDFNTAYAMFDEEGKKATDLETFTSAVGEIFPEQPKIKEFKIEGRGFHISTGSDKTSKINGLAIFSDGKEFEFQTELIKTDGKWFVRGFDWQPAENKEQTNQTTTMDTNQAADFRMTIPPGWIKTDSEPGTFNFVPSKTDNPDLISIGAVRGNDVTNSIESMTANIKNFCTPNAFTLSVRGEDKPVTLCEYVSELDIPYVGKTQMHTILLHVEDPSSASIWLIQANVKESAYETHADLLTATLQSFFVP